MSADALFHYGPIEPVLFEKLADHIVGKQSFALLGPRASGKRYVLEELALLLKQRGCPFVHVCFDQPGPLTNEIATTQNFHRRLQGHHGVVLPAKPWKDFASLFEWLQAEGQRLNRPVCLLLGNFGRLSEAVASRFLSLVRGACDAEKLVVGICGEGNITGLVHGEFSCFQCDHYYVVQGMSRNVFHKFFGRMLTRLHLPIKDPEKFSDALFEKTGGDARLLRHVLHAFAMRMTGDAQEKQLIVEDLPDDFLQFEELRVWSFDPFGPVQKFSEALNENELTILGNLSISKKGCLLPVEYSGPASKPHPLELMGLARRNREGKVLEFSSPYAEKFGRYYFTPTRLGDLFASNQAWNTAFAWYEKVPDAERSARPHSPSDYSVVRQLVDQLCGQMQRELAQTTDDGEALERIQNLAVKGLKHLLALHAVSFWKLTQDESWKQLSGDSDDRAGTLLQSIDAVSAHARLENGALRFDKNGKAHYVLLETPDHAVYALVAANWDQLHLPAMQNSLTRRLLRDFGLAWRHVANVTYTDRRLKERREIMGTTSEVFAALGRDINDVPGALAAIGKALIKLRSFRRVVWLLKVPGKSKLRLIGEPVDEKLHSIFPQGFEVDIDEDLKLATNCFAEALRDKKPKVYERPNQSTAIPEECRQELKGVTFVVGLRDESNIIVGCVLIEQEENIISTLDLKGDLEALASRIAILVQHAERIEAFQKAIEGIPDPIFVVDTKNRIRYLNGNTAYEFDLTEDSARRWLPVDERIQCEKIPKLQPIWGRFSEIISDEQPGSKSFFSSPQGGNQTLWNVSAAPLRDTFNGANGHVIRLRDRTAVFQALRALFQMSKASNTSECLERFFEAARTLSGRQTKMARLYVIDPESPDTLVSKRAVGMTTQRQARFERGSIRIEKEKYPDSWAALDTNNGIHPICWHWNPGGKDRQEKWTKKGLRYREITRGDFVEELEKIPGEFWLDLPLIAQDQTMKPIGKISLAFEKVEVLPSPDAFEYIAWFAQVASGVLGGVSASEKRLRDIEKYEKQALAICSHNIKTKTAPLSLVCSKYANLADDYRRFTARNKHLLDSTLLPALELLRTRFETQNTGFAEMLRSLDVILERMKDRLRGVIVDKPVSVRLKAVVEEAYLSVENRADLKITGSATVLGDYAYLLMAFQELCRDSVTHFNKPGKVLIQVKLSKNKKTASISYQDNGPGVPGEFKQRIFEPFFRAGKESAGTGVGLYFVRNVIEAHRGAIEEKGIPGEGVKFAFKFNNKR